MMFKGEEQLNSSKQAVELQPAEVQRVLGPTEYAPATEIRCCLLPATVVTLDAPCRVNPALYHKVQSTENEIYSV